MTGKKRALFFDGDGDEGGLLDAASGGGKKGAAAAAGKSTTTTGGGGGGKKRPLLLDGDGDGDDDDGGLLGRGSGSKSAAGLLAGDDDNKEDAAAVLGFNPAYAARFEHNKRREELHRLQERNPRLAAKLEREAARELAGGAVGDGDDGDDDDEDDESSSSSDDDLEELAARDDTDRVLAVLTALKKKDPSIKQPDVRFFDDDDDNDDEEGAGAGGDDDEKKKKTKDKPVYLRQVIAQQALDKLDGGGGGDDTDDDDERANKSGPESGGGGRIPLYNQEQAELKRDFLRAAEEAATAGGGGDEAGGFGIVRRGKQHGGPASAAGQDKDKDKRVQKMLEEYFGADDNLDPDERFLKSYLANKEWLKEDGDDDSSSEEAEDEEGGADGDDKGSKKKLTGKHAATADPASVAAAYADVEADEAFLEQADKFEANYNFRYEAPGAAQIVGHPRVIEDVVRKKDDKRARKRKEKAERQAAEEAARREDVKRLKNLKKAEIQDKLLAVQQVAGVAAPDANLVDALLEGDFDPDEYDRRMAAAFGEDYYDKDEEEGDVVEDAQAARLLRDAGAVDSDDEEEDQVPIGAKSTIDRSATRKSATAAAAAAVVVDEAAAAEARAQVSQLMEEYYSLDYEGTAGGMKTRFKYRQVEPSTLGLTIDEILRLPDKSLNQIASLKLLAPYRDGPKPRPNYKALQAVREEQMAAAGGKRRRPSGGSGGRGGHQGLRVEVEGEQKTWHDKWKRPSQEHMDKPTARAASFAPLSLNKPQSLQQGGGPPPLKKAKAASSGGGGGGGAERAAAAPSAPSLTKAQKKNLKRASKRAAERQKA